MIPLMGTVKEFAPRPWVIAALLLAGVHGAGCTGEKPQESAEPSFSVVQRIDVANPPDGAVKPAIAGYFPIQDLLNYQIRFPGFPNVYLQVAEYTDRKNNGHRAVVYPSSATAAYLQSALPADEQAEKQPADVRHRLWNELGQVIRRHTAPSALFVSWWDNSQRVHLLTGRQVWLKQPAQSAYQNQREAEMWSEIAGGLAKDDASRVFAQALLEPAEQGVARLAKALRGNKDVFLLVGSDDLARLGEMTRLAGVKASLEMRVFPQSSHNVHTLIAHVKGWASDGHGTGSYMVQRLPQTSRVRVWRVTDKAFEDSLLVRLLPFTSSLEKEGHGPAVKLVYQSPASEMGIYQLAPALLDKE